MAKEIFLVEGMSCASCALTIEKTVNQLPEVEQAVVNLATEKLTVTYQDDDLETAKVIQAVKAAVMVHKSLMNMQNTCKQVVVTKT